MQDIAKIRNVAIIGHGNCGKTSIAEAMLYTAGKINRLGKVDDGNSVMDFDEVEIERNISIHSSFDNYKWKKHNVYLIDTPGDDNFLNETFFATNIADSVVFTVGAVLGVKGQTVKFSNFIADQNVPAAIFINKMDRERASFSRTIGEIEEKLSLNPVVLHMPIGEEDSFRGYIDVSSSKAYEFTDDGKAVSIEIPDDLQDDLDIYREILMEKVAETDDDLIEIFLEDGELSEEDVKKGLRQGVLAGSLNPIIVGAATENKGTAALLDIINEILPSPLDIPSSIGTDPKTGDLVEREHTLDEKFSAMVFKTMADPYAGRLTIFKIKSGVLSGDVFYNANKDTTERFGQLFVLEGKNQRPVDEAVPGMIVAVAKLKETVTGDTLCDESSPIIYDAIEPFKPVISYAVSVKQGNEEKLFSSITKMLDEDLTLKMSRVPQTSEVILSGMGQVHLQVLSASIKQKFGVDIELDIPNIPYQETIKNSVTVQGKHKKQSGGRGQYGDCTVEISPLPHGEGFVFEDKIVGGVIPQTYRPAVEKGIMEAMEKGVLAGYPVVDVKIVLIDGSYHDVDSSEMAFKIAGSLAFKKGAVDAGLVLLEPYMNMTVRVGKDNVGDIMGDLNSRRGKVMGMDSESRNEVIIAQVPMSEIQLYATDLTSMTGGLGSFEVEFSHYEEVPAHLTEKIVAEKS